MSEKPRSWRSVRICYSPILDVVHCERGVFLEAGSVMTEQPNVSSEGIVGLDEPKKMTREDWRKKKELEEQRKLGNAPAEVDEEGK